MASELELLRDLQALQQQVRSLEEEDLLTELTGSQSGMFHRGFDEDGKPLSNQGAYQSATGGTLREGQLLATSGERSPGHLPWIDAEKNTYNPVGFADVPCANNVNCLDDNFCYGTLECPDCEVCRNHQCVYPDPNETCESDRDCPCDPNEDQKWHCLNDECKLTCRQNSDCGLLGRNVDTDTGEEICFACDPRTGYCGPGCNDDQDCKGKAADSQPNTFCIDCECKTPCEKPNFCDTDKDCEEYFICEEHIGRVQSDGLLNTGKACVSGCRVDEQCPSKSLIDEEGVVWETQEKCIANQCEEICDNDSECFPGESCIGSKCEVLGEECLSTDDCDNLDQICLDGVCQSGCRNDAKCEAEAACERDPKCLALCPLDQTCFCKDCDEDDWSWIEKCPLDPGCVAACPAVDDCIDPPADSQKCFEGKCLWTCSHASQCWSRIPDNGKGWKCDVPPKEPEREEAPGPCDDYRRQAVPYEDVPKRCIKVTSDGDGPVDEQFGCEDTDCCDQQGQCQPCVCTTDADCPAGGICQDNECGPGCSEDHPCPSGQCCGPDQKCHLTCTTDSNCPDPEMCLAGGCCGIACEPLVFCNRTSDCPDGEYCDGASTCQSGCGGDQDCEEDEICFQFGCVPACQDSADCNRGTTCSSVEECEPDETCDNGYCMKPRSSWREVCNQDGYCEDNPPVCCFVDSECSSGQELDEDGQIVRTFGQICNDGQCSEGCRRDSDCKNGVSCLDGQCKRECFTDADCPGSGSQCTEDGRAYKEQLREVAKCNKDADEKEASGLYDPRTIAGLRQQCRDLKQEIEENRATGYCQEINPGEGGEAEGGRTGCECFEECDEVGRCEPIGCSTDEQCPCGSCLSSGQCGDCWTDSDCQGRKKCDRAQICDDNGDNCQDDPEQGGTCVYGCLPPEPCEGDADCPNDTYCGTIPGEKAGGSPQCIQGCRDDSFCPPGMLCDTGNCVPICNGNGDCNTDYESCLDSRCVYTGWLCFDDGDCPSDLGYCRGGKCIPDGRCSDNGDCAGESECSFGFCSDFNSEDPYDQGQIDPEAAEDLGCESCAECCTSKFLCEPCPCTEHSDCPCGVCADNGKCKETCQTNADCIDGYCLNGDCVECITDQNCWTKDFPDVPDDQKQYLQCSQNNVCETPCFTGLSSGDCFEGLQIGDTCQNCPEKCPDGASCRENPDRVCGLNRKWNPNIGDNGNWSYEPILCIECYMPCTETCGCPDGHICEDGGCITASERCGTSAACPCDAPECRLGRCRVIGDACFAGSDCEPKYDENEQLIPQVCEFGNCKDGVCSEEYPCGRGQTCVDGYCFNSCDDVYLACGRFETTNDDGITIVDFTQCPPGYVCDNDRCVSEDYLGVGETMNCGSGKFCDRGGCVPIEYGVRECGSDDDCNEPMLRAAYMNCRQEWGKDNAGVNRCVELKMKIYGRVCDDSLCRKQVCDPRDIAAGTCEKPRAGRPNEQDSCEPRGLCCGDDGFCVSCECDEDNPCKEPNHCCDQETGVCLHVDDHIDTQYGAPKECRFGKVFCELLDPEGNSFTPSEDFNDPTVPGCQPEVECEWDPTVPGEVCEELIRCWDGRPLNFAQVRQELNVFCDPDDEKCSDGCGEDMPPEENECYYDSQCGSCQICRAKFWRGDECCPMASTLINGEGEEIEIDGIYRNICQRPYEYRPGREEEECRCLSNDDCTECETCELSNFGGGDNGIIGDETFGKCKLNCDLCPCGGDSSSRDGACKSCSDRYGYCAIEGQKVLKEEYVDTNTGQLIPAETACACVIDRENTCCEAYEDIEHYASGQLDSGCIRKEIVDENGINRVIQVAKCIDSEEGICAQCANDSDCGGFQTCRNGICIGQCGQENSAAGEADYGYGEKDCTCCSDDMTCREIYESWTESIDGDESQLCRPCTCTENGIDCADFIPCESCYKWVRTDGSAQGQADTQLSEAQKKTQMFGLEQALYEEQLKQIDAEDKATKLAEGLNELEAEISYWDSQVAVCDEACQINFGELECDGGPSQVEQCIEAVEQQGTKQGELDALNGQIDQQNEKADLAALEQAKISDKIANTDFTYGSWTQVRNCECCVDGQCRSDEDCTYGTCFLCMERFTGWYGVGVWGTVLQNPVCMGMNSRYTSYGGWDKPELSSSCPCYECPDPGGEGVDTRICGNTCDRSEGGPQFVHYTATHGEDACVQYRCRDGIQTEERLAKGSWERYYEYCSGSIIGCLIGSDACRSDECCLGRRYTNGYKFEYRPEDAGTFVGNYHLPSEDWIKISGIDEKLIKAECLYPNPLGHVRGHHLPTFYDVIAAHPCCNKGEFWTQCDPEHPGCQTLLRIHYQPGDVSGLIKRLYREINALGLEIAYGALFWWQMEWEIDKVKGDIEDLESEKDKLEQEYENLERQLNDLINEKKRLEGEIKDLDEKINGECEEKEQIICEEICEPGEPDCREECTEFNVCNPVFDEDLGEFVDECEIQENCIEICVPTEECRQECEIETVYKESESNGQQCRYEHYQELRIEAGEKEKEAIEIRDEKQDEIDASKEAEDLYKENYENAKNLVKEAEKDSKEIQNRIEAITDLQELNDCEGEGAETPECVNWDLEINAPGGLNDQLAEIENNRQDYESQQFLWFDEWQNQKADTEILEAELEPLQRDVDRAHQEFNAAYDEEFEKKEELDESIGLMAGKQQELLQVNQDIEAKTDQIEELEGKVDTCKRVEIECEPIGEDCKEECKESQICTPDPISGEMDCITGENCSEVCTPIFPTGGCFEEECQEEGAIPEQIKKLEEVIKAYEESQEELCRPGPPPEVPLEGGVIDVDAGSCGAGLIGELQAERKKKKEQVKKLEEDDQKPTVPTLVTGGPPSDSKTSEELQKAYKEQLERDKEKLDNPWYPG